MGGIGIRWKSQTGGDGLRVRVELPRHQVARPGERVAAHAGDGPAAAQHGARVRGALPQRLLQARRGGGATQSHGLYAAGDPP